MCVSFAIAIYAGIRMLVLHAGSHKHFGRRGPAHGVKDVDGSSTMSEGKHLRKGTGYNSHEVIELKTIGF